MTSSKVKTSKSSGGKNILKELKYSIKSESAALETSLECKENCRAVTLPVQYIDMHKLRRSVLMSHLVKVELT